MTVRALLIDIDNTVIRFRHTYQGIHDTGSLFWVLKDYATTQNRMSPTDFEQAVVNVKNNIRWWVWEDFMHELGISPDDFWSYALAAEQKILEPIDDNLGRNLERLRRLKIKLCITSNNGYSGILHKLRLAGLNDPAACIDRFFGCSEVKAMKWEEIYWRRVIAGLKLDPAALAVIGDDLRDDAAIPRQAGIPLTFLMHGTQVAPGIRGVRNFGEVADYLEQTR